MNITEEFNRVNDYTLRVDTRHAEWERSGVTKITSCTTLFNFLKCQQTTIHRDWIYEGRGTQSAGTAALTTHVLHENFDDLPCTDEVRLMHKMLKRLGGKPPAIDQVLNTVHKPRQAGLTGD
jgi:hypothetical protein